jgi:hypothetical protein
MQPSQVEELERGGTELWDTKFVLEMTCTCQQLSKVETLQLPEPPRATLKARTAALRSLLKLQHLRCLGVVVWDDKELGIIAELLGLRELRLVVAKKCTKDGVLQLEKLRQEGQLQAMSVNRGRGTISGEEWRELRTRLPIDWKWRSL